MTRGASVQVREATDQASPGRETDLRADAASPRAAARADRHTRVARTGESILRHEYAPQTGLETDPVLMPYRIGASGS